MKKMTAPGTIGSNTLQRIIRPIASLFHFCIKPIFTSIVFVVQLAMILFSVFITLCLICYWLGILTKFLVFTFGALVGCVIAILNVEQLKEPHSIINIYGAIIFLALLSYWLLLAGVPTVILIFSIGALAGGSALILLLWSIK